MSSRKSFLNAIRANPADDLPRLVYADWLDEHGDTDRAEFIRLQCELEPIRYQIENPRTRELLPIEEGMLADHRDEWLGAAADLADYDTFFATRFRRGFADVLCLPVDGLLRDGVKWFRVCPTIRELAVIGLENSAAQLLTSPVLERVDVLEIASFITPEDTRGLIASPRFGRQKVIRFWNGDFGTSPLFHVDAAHEWAPSGRVEYVQLAGGLDAGGELAAAHDREADECVAGLNEAWGADKAVVIRPFLRKFQIHQDSDSPIGGRFPSGNFGLAKLGGFGPEAERVVVAEFTPDGRYLSHRLVERPKIEPWSWDPFVAWVRENLQLRPSSFQVGEFDAEDFAFRLWKWGDVQDILRGRCDEGDLWGWMYDHRYVIRGMGEVWADYRGFVTDT